MSSEANEALRESVNRRDVESEKFAIDLSIALGVISGAPGFEIPAGLLPSTFGSVTRVGDSRSIFFVNAQSLPDPFQFATINADANTSAGTADDANNFAKAAKTSHLVFGVQWDHQEGWLTSNLIQSRTTDALLFIRLLSQGQSEDSELFHYLNDLTLFIEKSKQLGLSLEVVETPEYARYRLFDENGDGVEKEMTLVGNLERNKELNRLVAEISLRRVGTDPKVERFRVDDQSFQEWQFKYPSGVVMVLGLTRPLLHVAGCPTMIKERRSEFEMVCAPDVSNLLVWADENGRRIPGLCSKCFTLPSVS